MYKKYKPKGITKKEIIKFYDKKKNKKKLEKECMKLWAELVKKKAKNMCEYPGCYKTQNLNAHHIFTRAKKSTVFDPENGLCLCPYHHTLGAEAAHRDPNFKDIIVEAGVRTDEFYRKLRLKAFTPQKLDLEMELLYLKTELKKYD